jgi:hypothetical protein
VTHFNVELAPHFSEYFNFNNIIRQDSLRNTADMEYLHMAIEMSNSSNQDNQGSNIFDINNDETESEPIFGFEIVHPDIVAVPDIVPVVALPAPVQSFQVGWVHPFLSSFDMVGYIPFFYCTYLHSTLKL